MITWPSDLPQCFLRDNFTFELPNNSIRTDMDSGATFQRPRYTGIPQVYEGSMLFTPEQLESFRSFWREDMVYGTQELEWRDPVTGEKGVFRFVSDDTPKVQRDSARKWRVTFKVERL